MDSRNWFDVVIQSCEILGGGFQEFIHKMKVFLVITKSAGLLRKRNHLPQSPLS